MDEEISAQIRKTVQQLCQEFPGPYWQQKDRDRAYPSEFVAALTSAGLLSSLIPEQYGGAGLSLTVASMILEEIHANGCNGAACHAQMYTMGTLLRHGSEEQRQQYLPGIASGELRLQAFGVTEPTAGTDTTSISTIAIRDGDDYVVNGQKVWTARAEYSDLILIMSVEPGFGGQSYIPEAEARLARTRDLCRSRGVDPILEVDGGIDPETVSSAVEGGAEWLVAGSAIFRQDDPNAAWLYLESGPVTP